MYNTTKMTTSCMVVLLLIACLLSTANRQVTGNTLFLAHYSYKNFGSYIGWLSASPESYKNNETLHYETRYFSTDHYWNSIAAYYHAGNVTFHDTRNHWIYLSDDFETHGVDAHPIERGTSGRVLGMTIDWLAQNVYWVDEGYNWIKMTNYLRGGHEATIVDTGLERPSGIACHPMKGYLFWTELGNKYPPKIQRSSMTGANRTTIVTGLSEPRSIAVDIITNRLIFWTEQTTPAKVVSCDLDGTNRHDVIYISLENPSGIALDYAQRSDYNTNNDHYTKNKNHITFILNRACENHSDYNTKNDHNTNSYHHVNIICNRATRKPHQSGDTYGLTTSNDNRYTTHLPQGVYEVPKVKEDPPTYESSIGAYGRNQAIGGEPYIVTKFDHQFDTPNTVALYSKSEPPLVLSNPYCECATHLQPIY